MTTVTDPDRTPHPGPYGGHALAYLAAGWAPLPLPARAKKHPPAGYTGTGGTWPSTPDVYAWTEDHADGNIALRLPPGVLGIDVDAYGTKPGGLVLAQLEAQHGPLPATWRSTSRDDGVSGIRFYAIPEGLRWPGVLGPGIETIRHGHRYAVAWPSTHPDTGGTYRWVTPAGTTALHDIPTTDTLPALPEPWVQHFTGGELAADQARAGLNDTAAQEWLAARARGGPCRGMTSLADKALAGFVTAGSRHEHMLTATNRLVWTAGTGHTGITTALAQLRAAFLAAATDRAPGEAEAEWDRMVSGAVDLAAAAHPAEPPPDPCDDPHGLAALLGRDTRWTNSAPPPPPCPTAATATPPEGSSTPTPGSMAQPSTSATAATSGPADGAPTAPGSTSPNEDDSTPDDPPSWGRIDLGPYLDGTYKPIEPTLLPRADGVNLLYRGRTHSFHGESESGKSLVLQIYAAQLIANGHDVLYIDFEDDQASVTERLLTFGAPADAIRAHFDYRRPEVKPTTSAAELDAWNELLGASYTLAVIDGVTDALGIFGYSTKDNDEIAAWMRAFPRNVAKRTGAAVVVIDHVTKNSETRGRFAIGGQAKMNAVTGSAFTVEISKPLGRGLAGEIVLRVGKDRGGYIRSRSGPMRASDRTQETARVTVDSTTEGRPVVTFAPPREPVSPTGSKAPMRMTGVMEKISRTLEKSTGPLTGRGLQELVGGNKDRFAAGLRTLIEEDYVSVEAGSNRATLHASLKPYRQSDDPLSDMYRGDEGIIPSQCPPVPPGVPECPHGDTDSGCPQCPPPFRGHGDTHAARGQTTASGVPNGARTAERVIAGERVVVNLDTGEVIEP